MKHNPLGDFHESAHMESSQTHSRTIWRLQGLCHAVYPGIQEGFVVQKTDLETGKIDLQHFITNRPPFEWDSRTILERIRLHWDTETGVFGIKDNTFHEDKVRYKSLNGASSHVSLLNIAWNCLSAPAFEQYWKGMPMSHRIQFFKDHPEYNPLEPECLQ